METRTNYETNIETKIDLETRVNMETRTNMETKRFENTENIQNTSLKVIKQNEEKLYKYIEKLNQDLYKTLFSRDLCSK
jgi:hypothetical protein